MAKLQGALPIRVRPGVSAVPLQYGFTLKLTLTLLQPFREINDDDDDALIKIVMFGRVNMPASSQSVNHSSQLIVHSSLLITILTLKSGLHG